MQCPFCCYRRKKSDNNPHWQCPSCEKAYNKVHTRNLKNDSMFGNNVTYNDRVNDFITNFSPNIKGILKIAFSILFLFWGIEEFLIEGVYYTSNYYQYFQMVLGSDLFIFSILVLFLLFITGAVIFIGRKVVGSN
tara:strand:- start:953 stop:1357 length:405 start_codon:yes stop_codon:yes gene_type:complete